MSDRMRNIRNNRLAVKAIGRIHTAYAPLHTSSPRITPTARPSPVWPVRTPATAPVPTPTPAGASPASISALPFGRGPLQPAALLPLCAHLPGFSLAGAQPGSFLSAGASPDPGLCPLSGAEDLPFRRHFCLLPGSPTLAGRTDRTDFPTYLSLGRATRANRGSVAWSPR